MLATLYFFFETVKLLFYLFSRLLWTENKQLLDQRTKRITQNYVSFPCFDIIRITDAFVIFFRDQLDILVAFMQQ